MRLHVIRPHAGRFRDRLENADLISDGVKNFLGRDRQFFAPKIFPIEKTRMRANGNFVRPCRID